MTRRRGEVSVLGPLTQPWRVVGSTSAREALQRLTARRGRVLFIQSARCIDCGEPACYGVGEYQPLETDVRVGAVDGTAIWIDRRLAASWPGATVVLDVERGYGTAPALPAGDGLCFVIRFTGPR